MIYRRLAFLCLLLVNSLGVRTQELYIPYNIQRAIERGSRTTNGIPGIAYFQNYSDYNIKAEVDLRKALLKGLETINYHNNSNDTLRKIVLRLYQNIFAKGAARDEFIATKDINNGIIIEQLIISGINYQTSDYSSGKTATTNRTIYLSKPLLPMDSCFLQIEWKFKLPSEGGYRFGKYATNTYFMGYWYPQMAVYDDIDGWDEIEYTGTQEFYNDFNNYRVKLTLPSNCMVWATGSWENFEEILSDEIAGRFRQAKISDSLSHIITAENILQNTIFKSNGKHSFDYTASGISDFSFAFSDRYIWDALTVSVDPSENQKVTVSSVYPEKSSDFKEVAQFAGKIVEHLSSESYGVPYPFPAVTIFKGEGGMEYPMMVNNGSMLLRNGTVFLTVHEVAHAYFPFITGINERKYAWMDEGLTTYLPIETERFMKSDYYSLELIVKKYESSAGTESDVPCQVSSSQLRGFSYQYHTYFRSAVAFSILENYMGREAFRKSIKEFINIWQYKHPVPVDLFAIFQKEAADKQVEWLVENWFGEFGWPDLGIESVVRVGDSLEIAIIKKGKLPVPVQITVKYSDGSSENLNAPVDIWKNNNIRIFKNDWKETPSGIYLGNRSIPDRDRRNNYYDYQKANPLNTTP
jgi:hypothetical protein